METTYSSYVDSFHQAFDILQNALRSDMESFISTLAKLQVDFQELLDFYALLQTVKIFLAENPRSLPYRPRIYVVEGLDGSGKTSLAQALANHFQIHVKTAFRTPPAYLSRIRGVFDKYPGQSIVARAFYMACNYIFMNDAVEECLRWNHDLIFVLDRWYGSTCSYSIGQEVSSIELIDQLPQESFSWPQDLLRPELVLQLTVDSKIRRARVSDRAKSTGKSISSDSNPWDQLLQHDTGLEERIQYVFDRMDVPKAILDGNQPFEKVLADAIQIITSNIDNLATGKSLRSHDSLDEEMNKKSEEIKEIAGSSVMIADGKDKNPSEANGIIPALRKPITIALIGPHTSGKRTIGLQFAKKYDCIFQEELGDVLRDVNHLVLDGHLYGDGVDEMTSKQTYRGSKWDDYIHEKEIERDELYHEGFYAKNRIVETWHPGNLLWALQRKHSDDNHARVCPDMIEEERAYLMDRCLKDMVAEVKRNREVVIVLFNISIDTMRHRRKNHIVSSLPMSDEYNQCSHLHHALFTRGEDIFFYQWKQILAENNIKTLMMENNHDGAEAIDQIVQNINNAVLSD